MATMARASRAELADLWQSFGVGLEPVELASPETGMVRLTTKAGQSDVHFQFGEASCTRCVVELNGYPGYAVHLGSDHQKAFHAACLDALFQMGDIELETALSRLADAQAEKQAKQAEIAEATKVRFFTTKPST